MGNSTLLKRRVFVEVTQKHIDRGVKSSARTCPIALAFQDLGFKEARVGGQNAYPDGLDSPKTIPLPYYAREFIANFDKGITVTPFGFSVDV